MHDAVVEGSSAARQRGPSDFESKSLPNVKSDVLADGDTLEEDSKPSVPNTGGDETDLKQDAVVGMPADGETPEKGSEPSGAEVTGPEQEQSDSRVGIALDVPGVDSASPVVDNGPQHLPGAPGQQQNSLPVDSAVAAPELQPSESDDSPHHVTGNTPSDLPDADIPEGSAPVLNLGEGTPEDLGCLDVPAARAPSPEAACDVSDIHDQAGTGASGKAESRPGDREVIDVGFCAVKQSER
jgi:hypothetical protein